VNGHGPPTALQGGTALSGEVLERRG
jgi:hypothetical protein